MIAVATGVVAPAGTAQPVHKDCAPEAISKLTAAEIGSAWRLHHPDSVFDRMAELFRRNAWRGVLDTITAHFETMPGDVGANRVRILQELGELAPVMVQGETNPAARGRDAAPAAHWLIVGDPEEDAVDLFRDEPASRIRVTAAVASDARRRMCWTAMLTLRVLTAYNSPALATVVMRLNELTALWDSYGANSYSQLPWELYLNGRLSLGRPYLEPPKAQIVLLHPTAGVEVTGGNYPNWRQSSAFAVEMAGLLFYNEARSSFWGGSISAVVTDQSRIGFGPILHWGRALQIGYAIRPRDAAGKSTSGAVMSLDVFKFVTGVPQFVAKGKLDALKQHASCLRTDAAGCR